MKSVPRSAAADVSPRIHPPGAGARQPLHGSRRTSDPSSV